jgi:arylsulfatase A-like enzyme
MTTPSGGAVTDEEPSIVQRTNIAPPQCSFANFMLMAISFGVIAGCVEGAELLAFQHLNWTGWARELHIAKQMLWISPAVDLIFFLLIALVLFAALSQAKRVPAATVLIAVLAFLTFYDWLRATGRLYRSSCILLALGLAVVLVRWLRKHENRAMAFFRRSAAPLLLLFCLLIAGIEGGMRLHEAYVTARLPKASSNAPNVIVIVLDTARADHFSAYGYERETTPRIDELARHAVLFENAIASSSWSLPSHASLLTGRPVHEHGWGNIRQIPWMGWGTHGLNGLPTVGEALQRLGYRTGAFSANSIYFTSNVGMGRGFIHFEDYFENTGDALVRTEFGREFSERYMNRSKRSAFTRAFHALGLARWLDKDSEGSGMYGGAFGVRKRADDVNAETVRWIQRDSEHPFFVFLNYFDVHYAYGGPEEHPRPAWDNGKTVDEYDAGLNYDDEYVGRLLDRLKQAGILKNTVVLITSDHGESLGDHGLKYHGSCLYRELVHVPLIVSWPGHTPEGLHVEEPVSTALIASTLTAIAGGDAQLFPGPPLTELWGESADSKNSPDAVSELPQTNNFTHDDQALQGKEPLASNGSMRSIVSSQWQLIQHEKWPDRIYDWKTDPKELKDLIGTPEGKAAHDEILRRAGSAAWH